MLGAPLANSDGSATDPEYLHYSESQKLYQWAFNNFSVRTVVDKGELLAECPVKYSFQGDHIKVETGEKCTALMENSLELTSVQYQVDLPESLAAPVKKGDQVGTLRLVLAEEEIGSVPLLASESLRASGFLTFLGQAQNLLHLFWVKVLVVFVILLILGYLWLFFATNRKRKRRRNYSSYDQDRRQERYHL